MYIKLTNGIPTEYTIGRLRRDNPNTSFPKIISEARLAFYNVYPVVEADEPSYDERTQTVHRNADPTLIDGVWTYGWTVSDKSAEEIQDYDNGQKAIVRNRRDSLLAETDWTGLSDVTMSAEMTTYRQALRDITTHANFPYLEEADWPVKP